MVLFRLVVFIRYRALILVDPHRTTGAAATKYRPAPAAIDGKAFMPGGFYLVDDRENPQPEFKQAVIAAVEKVTHIAPADDKNTMIVSPVVACGVTEYPLKQVGLCASVINPTY